MAAIQTKANSLMKRRGTQYKQHYNAKVYIEAEFVTNQWMFEDKPSLPGKANPANEMTKNQLFQVTAEHGQILLYHQSAAAPSHFDQDGEPYTLSVHQTTPSYKLRNQLVKAHTSSSPEKNTSTTNDDKNE